MTPLDREANQSPGIIGRARGALQALRPRAVIGNDAEPGADVIGMLGMLGASLLASSQATNDVEETLNRLAQQYDRADLRVFVLPTIVMVEDPRNSSSATSLFAVGSAPLRLDQVDAVERLVREASRSTTPPQDVVARLGEIRSESARFGPVLTVFGYTLLTVGFGLVLNPTVTALPVYVLLGVVVGSIVLIGNRVATLSLILPVLTAFSVTLLISLLVRPFVHDDVLRLVAPSLVSFLPGLTLTIAAVELTSGQMMAGASRLVSGIARLGLLTFGVYAGISIAGEPPAPTTAPMQLGAWAPWAGIVLVALGYYLYSAAPRRSLVWILYALVVAYSGQLLGDRLVGAELSGLIGALIVIPAVMLAGRLSASPSTAVMLTCAYWLLVPGAMGFIGLSEAASGASGATDTIMRTFGSLTAIAIGMLLGAGLSRDVAAMSRGWRQARGRGGTNRPTKPSDGERMHHD
ncbi:threonine/serine exporter family protein [Microbacterium oxydans]|uniref:threonine/serine ThrE exporter family protein n=1 Tax=Microbacterium sp. B19(2022) TaxID=2914045 RepID=UPI0014305041|nr:threonine/serine exporter family protein [Microbacterium sp. B19(2022)]NJI61282.1 threonine/serine exporter family protein [Microbacterium sp. B19(2022)]